MTMGSNTVVLLHSCTYIAASILRRPERILYGFKSCNSSVRLRRYCCSSSLKDVAFVVADDEKYGNKQIISLTPRLYDYILSNVREPQVLRQLREETATMRGVSPDQAQLLAMLVRILAAQRCIEVGVYTGYSSLAVALALPESGCLVAIERDSKSLEVAKRYYERAGVSHKVYVKHGMAADILRSLIRDGEAGSYDFAFVDAEKRMNQEYFELLLQLVRGGGVIVVDNVLWHGKVADPLVNDAKTISIREFNKNLMEDKRISISMGFISTLNRGNSFVRLDLFDGTHTQVIMSGDVLEDNEQFWNATCPLVCPLLAENVAKDVSGDSLRVRQSNLVNMAELAV